MTEHSGLNEDFNRAIESFLPEEVESSEAESEADLDSAAGETDHRWWRIMQEWHLFRSVDDYRRDQLVTREIDNYVEVLDLPVGVGQMAEQVFEQYATTRDHLVIELTAAAAVYSAGKINEEGITPDALVDADDGPLDRTMLLRQSKEIVGELGLDPSAFFNSEAYVDEFGTELDLPAEVRERAKQILAYCDEEGASSGKSPTGWAAAATYLACLERDLRISQDEIGAVADVSTVTIRNRYHEQRTVVIERECPDQCSAVVDWVCNRVGLPDGIRAEANGYTEMDIDLEARGRHDIPLSFEEDPTGWGMAAVKLAAENHEYQLAYRPLKALSRYEARSLKRRVRVLRNATRYL